MTGHPLISVLVPVFNCGAYIDAALASIAIQSFPDFEVIISDDCSNDRSLKKAENWSQQDKRFQVIPNTKNIGMTPNWNRALAHASGHYVIKLDADDVMRPNCLEILVNKSEQNHTIDVACCRTLSCDENLEPFGSYKGDEAFIREGIDPLRLHLRSGYDWYLMCFNDIQLWQSNAMMHRRKNLLDSGGWDDTWGCAADTDLILRVLEKGKNVCHHPYVGILYRHRPDSVSANYRKHGWLQWEDALLHLASLKRSYHKMNSFSFTLRKAWWQYWQRWKSLKNNQFDKMSNIPEPYRKKIIALSETMPSPPLSILAEGLIRQQLWNVKSFLYKLLKL